MRSALTKSIGFAVSAALIAAVCTTSGDASAASEVSGTGKGIAGGALLGGEIGFLGLSAFGAKQSWLYYTIPPALAIGGGVAGYFIEKDANPEVPLYMLAGGMALVIPTVVVTLSATSYNPSSEDATPGSANPVEGNGTVEVNIGPGAPATTTGTPTTPTPGSGTTTTNPPPGLKHKPDHGAMRHLPRSFALVDWNEDASVLRFGLPVVQVKPAFTQLEVAKFGVAQRYEIHAPVVNVAF